MGKLLMALCTFLVGWLRLLSCVYDAIKRGAVDYSSKSYSNQAQQACVQCFWFLCQIIKYTPQFPTYLVGYFFSCWMTVISGPLTVCRPLVQDMAIRAARNDIISLMLLTGLYAALNWTCSCILWMTEKVLWLLKFAGITLGLDLAKLCLKLSPGLTLPALFEEAAGMASAVTSLGLFCCTMAAVQCHLLLLVAGLACLMMASALWAMLKFCTNLTNWMQMEADTLRCLQELQHYKARLAAAEADVLQHSQELQDYKARLAAAEADALRSSSLHSQEQQDYQARLAATEAQLADVRQMYTSQKAALEKQHQQQVEELRAERALLLEKVAALQRNVQSAQSCTSVFKEQVRNLRQQLLDLEAAMVAATQAAHKAQAQRDSAAAAWASTQQEAAAADNRWRCELQQLEQELNRQFQAREDALYAQLRDKTCQLEASWQHVVLLQQKLEAQAMQGPWQPADRELMEAAWLPTASIIRNHPAAAQQLEDIEQRHAQLVKLVVRRQTPSGENVRDAALTVHNIVGRPAATLAHTYCLLGHSDRSTEKMYYELSRVCHPDKGGCSEEFACLAALWKGIKPPAQANTEQ